jgi:hypothetical protein
MARAPPRAGRLGCAYVYRDRVYGGDTFVVARRARVVRVVTVCRALCGAGLVLVRGAPVWRLFELSCVRWAGMQVWVQWVRSKPPLAPGFLLVRLQKAPQD